MSNAGRSTSNRSGNPGSGGGLSSNAPLYFDAPANLNSLAYTGTNQVRLSLGDGSTYTFDAGGHFNVSGQGTAANGAINLGTGAGSGPALYTPAVGQFGVGNGTAKMLELATTALGAAPDIDATLAMGRCLLDSRVTDVAYFSHRDQTAAGAFGLRQNASGAGVGNSAAGQPFVLAINGSGKWTLDGTNFDFSPTDNSFDFGQTTKRIRRVFQSEYMEISEMTAPAAPGADKARLFCQDNGAGKTQLMVIFSSGAAQQVAIQP